MDHGQLSMVADKVHWVFAEPLLIKNENPTPICTPLTPPILRSLRLIWTAIAAALKRFLAHMTQLLTAVPMSTRKVAMCAVHVLGGIVQALKTEDVARLYDALAVAITYLAYHAQRAHPQRDRHTGRSQLGLEPLFGSDDVVDFAEAA